MTEQKNCFHCAEPNPKNSHYQVTINGQLQKMCCPGCAAVAQTIVDSGLTSYYTHRSKTAEKMVTLVPDELKQLDYYDLQTIQADFVKQNESVSEVTLIVEGVTCAACSWLIEKQLRFIPGLLFINVNTTLHRAIIKWDNQQLKLSAILKEIQKIGYKAYPFQVNKQEAFYRQQVKSYLRRLGLAGLATMQVMMFAIALYGDFFSVMETEFIHYFRWVSLILATPVLLYSAQPFYINGWRNLRNKTLGMDIPISIALLGAYSASAYATIIGRGEVYFESVSMFTFLLLLGRLLELRARRKAFETSSNLLRLLPSMAILIKDINKPQEQTIIPAKTLQVGQLVLVKAGETVPVDGTIINGASHMEESMLTGEHLPVSKGENDAVFAGSVNSSSPLTIRVEKLAQNSLIADIIHLQDSAQLNKPRIEIVADRVARYFVAALLVIASLTYIGWSLIAPDQAFWITLSVLVATCPCALSLATPTALTCATAQLNKQGILIKQHHVLETLNKIDHMVFDKTGTLSKGNFLLLNTEVYSQYSKQECIDLAAQLERVSEHPIARAFKKQQKKTIALTNIVNLPGQGLQGDYRQQKLKLGHALFCAIDSPIESKELLIYLTLDKQLLASFELGDELRESAPAIIDYCHSRNIKTTLLTGDISLKSEDIASQLHIDKVIKGVTPEGKLRYLQQLQKKDKILMVGDGINDAPVLAGADVSVTLASGSDIAKNSADVILLGEDLSKIQVLNQTAQKTTAIIKENLAWAIGYNLIIVPLAIMGHVPPYIAAIGMSFSSLIVVSNSLRLLK